MLPRGGLSYSGLHVLHNLITQLPLELQARVHFGDVSFFRAS